LWVVLLPAVISLQIPFLTRQLLQTHLIEDRTKPAQEDDWPHKVELVVGKGAANEDAAGKFEGKAAG
jgi:hypothetical protein